MFWHFITSEICENCSYVERKHLSQLFDKLFLKFSFRCWHNSWNWDLGGNESGRRFAFQIHILSTFNWTTFSLKSNNLIVFGPEKADFFILLLKEYNSSDVSKGECYENFEFAIRRTLCLGSDGTDHIFCKIRYLSVTLRICYEPNPLTSSCQSSIFTW